MIMTLPSKTPTIVSIKTGTEGPKYDPYGYTKITVERNGHKAVYHSGLLEVVIIDDQEYPANHQNDIPVLDERLLNTVGINWEALNAIPDMLMNKPLRCKCGKPSLIYQRGFVGEGITICKRCGQILEEEDATPYVI